MSRTTLIQTLLAVVACAALVVLEVNDLELSSELRMTLLAVAGFLLKSPGDMVNEARKKRRGAA